MKTVLLLFSLLLSNLIYSQNIDELNAASAGNIYYATNKTCYVSEYLTCPESRYILFVKSKFTESVKDYDYVYFSDKNEIVGFLNMAVRSVEKQKDIIHSSSEGEFVIINFTKNISKVYYKDLVFSMDKTTAKEIINQFSRQ